MASAVVPPLTALAPNHACPAIVSPEDVDYLLHVLRLDGGKSESDLDDEILAKAGALGIDITNLPVIGQGQGPVSDVSESVASLPACRRDLTPSTSQSSATSRSSMLEAAPTTRPPNARRWSDTLTFSLYDKYVLELGPNMTQPKLAKGAATEGAPPRFGFPKKKKTIANFTRPFKARKLWGKRPFPKSDGAT